LEITRAETVARSAHRVIVVAVWAMFESKSRYLGSDRGYRVVVAEIEAITNVAERNRNAALANVREKKGCELSASLSLRIELCF
jgi:hypothetical protein